MKTKIAIRNTGERSRLLEYVNFIFEKGYEIKGEVQLEPNYILTTEDLAELLMIDLLLNKKYGTHHALIFSDSADKMHEFLIYDDCLDEAE